MQSELKNTEIQNTIPDSWCGLWTDSNGKQLIIKKSVTNFYTITVLNAKNQYYKIELLNNEISETKNLDAKFISDTKNNLILQVEAGTPGIGPTYNLCFLTIEKERESIFFKNNCIIIRPSVEMGLYDDWDDDLGVSWAFPLQDFEKKEIPKIDKIDSVRRMSFYMMIGRFSLIRYPKKREEIKPFLIRFLISAIIIGTFIYLAINFL